MSLCWFVCQCELGACVSCPCQYLCTRLKSLMFRNLWNVVFYQYHKFSGRSKGDSNHRREEVLTKKKAKLMKNSMNNYFFSFTKRSCTSLNNSILPDYSEFN